MNEAFWTESSESSSSDSFLVPKILYKLLASLLSWLTSKLTLSSYSCSGSQPDSFLHSFLSSTLALEKLTFFFCFFFLCFTSSSSSLSRSDDGYELPLSSSDCVPILSLFPLALTLEGLFSNILPVKSSDLKISIFPKSWKLLFRHVCKSGCCCCFWVEHAFSLTKCGRKWL